MHKFFAKTLFLGKKIDFLTECHSTNDELVKKIKQNEVNEGHMIVTDFQNAGKGQRGNTWSSAPSKNILASLYLRPAFLPVVRQHYLTFMTAIAIVDALKKYIGTSNQYRLNVKWPNDVYLNKQKISGVLTECILQNSRMEAVVIGFGLNLNQVSDLPFGATSVKKETTRELSRLEVLEEIVYKIEKYYFQLQGKKYSDFLMDYYKNLMWLGESHFFRDSSGVFEGVIKGVNEKGLLIVETKGVQMLFNFKEVEFVR